MSLNKFSGEMTTYYLGNLTSVMTKRGVLGRIRKSASEVALSTSDTKSSILLECEEEPRSSDFALLSLIEDRDQSIVRTADVLTRMPV